MAMDRRFSKFAVFCGLVFCAFSPSTAKEAKSLSAAPITSENSQDYVRNEIIVKLRPGLAENINEALAGDSTLRQVWPGSLQRLNDKYKHVSTHPLVGEFDKNEQRIKDLAGKDVSQLNPRERHIVARAKRAPRGAVVPNLGNVYKIQFALDSNDLLREALDAYRNDPAVEYAELDYIVHIEVSPNDPLYSIQWSLQKINAPQAWDINTGSYSVIVAVADTGVDYNHRDISNNMWTDLNGYHGYDYVNSDNYPIDDHGHGTHCAGIIAAKGNNEKDIAGVCWNVKIMALKILDSSGSGSYSNAATAFYYAVNNGADIISNSWGGYDFSQTLQDAIDYAYSQGVILVAAAGNDYQYCYPHYPSSMEHVISVASTNSNDEKAPSSNYGDWIDISAPGVNVLSLRAAGTSMGSPYDTYTTYASGTSMACPHVSGVVALLLSEYPALSSEEITARLLDNADDISAANPTYAGRLGSGRINVYKSLRFNSEATVKFNRPAYSCHDVVAIEIHDFDISGTGTQHLTLTTTNGDSETVVLTEDANQPWIFNGAISTTGDAVNQNDGLLEVSDGEIITAAYTDLNFGDSGPHIVQNTVNVDCAPPNISHIRVHNITSSGARVRFQTNEPATVRIRYGQDCNNLCNIISEGNTPDCKHDIYLAGLISQTSYYFAIEANDIAGNLGISNNNGQCYSFTTSTVQAGLHVPADYPTIQAAVNAASAGDTIWLSDGTYTGSGNRAITYSGKSITVRSENGPNECIIDCENIGRAFTFDSGEDSNAVVDGITIRNGYAGGVVWNDQCGGAIHCYNSSPTISNCVFTNNHAINYGGAIVLGDLSPSSNSVINNCSFLDNSAQFGGGIHNGKGNQVITNCTFKGNLATYDYGGGVCCWENSHARIENCQFKNNASWNVSRGGAIGCMGAYPLIKNCLFIDNLAMGDYYGGGGIFVNHTNANIENCTFYGNTTTVDGGACHFEGNKDIYVSNCIFSNNYPNQIYKWMTTGQVYVSYSDVENGYSGTGNINADPFFVAGPLGNYYLSQIAAGQPADSPCVDAGSDMTVNLGMCAYTTRTDEIGDTGIVDMGYHYYYHPGFGTGDLNGDAFVNFVDYAILSLNWQQLQDPCDSNGGDINRDGQVDIYDLAQLVKDWLTCLVTEATTLVPADYAVNVSRNVILRWSPGENAASHDVYFGTDFDGVNEADITNTNVYMGNQVSITWDTNNYDSNGLEFNTTYYWRIDEVAAGCTAKGNVWSFMTRTSGFDPNFVSWWKFDEGTGTTAYDSAGNNNGTIYRATWTTGKIGGALSFDGVDDYIKVPDDSSLDVSASFTFAFWMYVDEGNPGGTVISKDGSEDTTGAYNIYYDRSHRYVWYETNNESPWLVSGENSITMGAWNHIAITFNGSASPSMRIYVDGIEKASASPPAPGVLPTCLMIGRRGDSDAFFNGKLDDVRIYNRALSAEELRIYRCVKASNPNPTDGQMSVAPNVVLNWLPGRDAVTHDVYFGTGYNDVNVAAQGSSEYMGNQDANYWGTNNYAPAGLDFNTTYYWRIDEVDATNTTKGDVWSFTVASLGKAKSPQPSNGKVNVTTHPILSWSAATYAGSHDVYFGTSYNDVNVAAHGSSEYMGNQDANNYATVGLDFNATYYWRIDEVAGGCTTKGDVWSFMTCPTIDDSIVAWWKFDEGTGTIVYDSAGHNDGNLVNGPAWITGQIGGALSFDGLDDYVQIPDNSSLRVSATFAFVFWMFVDEGETPTGAIISKDGSVNAFGAYMVYVNSNKYVTYKSNRRLPTVSSPENSISLGAWHHIAFTFDDSANPKMRVYIDGAEKASGSPPAPSVGVQSIDLMIGRRGISADPCYTNSKLDDVRIYNRTLSQDEVNLLYQQGL
jgi:thermitase